VAVLTPRLLLLAAVTFAGCFDPPQPGCAFSCATDGICPTGYSCLADGVCHRDDSAGACNIPSQTDAQSDTQSDAQTDAGSD
jgi:hypothetical protein